MLDWKQAVRAAEEQPVQPVYVCFGSEFAIGRQWLTLFLKRLSQDTGEAIEPMRFQFGDGETETALMACQSLPLFGGVQLAILDGVGLATGRGQARLKPDVERLEQYLEDPEPHNVLVILVPEDKLDERRKLTKRLKSFPCVDCTVPKEAQGKALVRVLMQRAAIEAEGAALDELWRRVGTVSRSYGELEKLWTYTDGQSIRVEDVRKLVSPPVDDNVFAWIDGVVKGNLSHTFEALNDVQRAGYDAFQLYGMLVRQLRLMWYALTLGSSGASQNEIAREAGAHPYAVQVAIQQSRGIRPRQLEELLVLVADMEFHVKSGRVDSAHALDTVLAACAQKLHPVHAGR